MSRSESSENAWKDVAMALFVFLHFGAIQSDQLGHSGALVRVGKVRVGDRKG